ncbi:MAG: VOC family protein [Gammaproteobacteria bacterium]|nr:VOC family protein [Gammaproteobacteria bacterium]
MALLRMEHYLVLTHDLTATHAFYRDVLGLADGFRPDLGFPGAWLYLGDVPCLHIAEWHTYTRHSNALGIPVTRESDSTGAFDHIAFTGNDYDGMISRLERAAIRFHRNGIAPTGLRQLFLDDPNGVKIELNFFPDAG